ncbi:LytTR family DNA-binding domain-containing protein [uncultured Kordia sp.]|uniref:LytR/AlgR family response regulator transcription factor n=1 Tax=uncultured Kordia sp. TaxID=507699 RepID=UPI00261ADAC4|nr:LytTR family DNA-binding domain-containing protein [uncultured Kordia sp.]
MKIKVLIIDDEQPAIDNLKELLIPYDNYIICGEALTLQHAIELTIIEKPNLVLLDIDLRLETTGFDYLNTFLPNINFKIIFVTAHNEFAIKAFEFNALHYLLKPVESNNFREALSKMNDLIKQRLYIDRLESLAEYVESKQPIFIFVNTTERIHKLDIRNLSFLEAKGNYTTIHLTNHKKITSAKTLLHYEKQLKGNHFFRIHHSKLVNLIQVKSYQKKQRKAILENEIILSVSIRREKGFLEALRKLKK